MNIAFLRNFLVVVDSGSIAQAARLLNISPTTLAQQIHSVERDLGVKLITRAGRSVSLTESGHRVIDQARDMVNSYSTMMTAAHVGAPPKELRIGAINTALQSFVPDTLVALNKHYPLIAVFIHASTAEKLLQEVQDGVLDAAIIPHPQFELPKSLSWRLLTVEPLIVLVPSKLRPRDPHEALCTQPFIRYDRNHWGGQLADRYLKRHAIQPKERIELASLLTIALMVDRGLGVSLVPDSNYPMPANLKLTKIPLGENQFDRLIGAVWRRGSPKEGLINVFIDHAREVVGGKGS